MAKNANGARKKIKKSTIALFVILGLLLLGILLLVIFRDAIVAEISRLLDSIRCTCPPAISGGAVENLQYQVKLSSIRTEI